MDTKEQLVHHIKSWIEMDNNITELQRQIKQCREEKKELTTSLVDVMKNNEIDQFDINDGKLIYSKSKIKKPINKKTLLTALNTYFKDENMVTDLSEHILNNREESIKESIRRKKEK